MAGSPKIDTANGRAQRPDAPNAFDEGGQAGGTSDQPSLAGEDIAAVNSGARVTTSSGSAGQRWPPRHTADTITQPDNAIG
jgi:hypothetical protein